MKKSIKSVNRILFGLYVLILIYIFIVRGIRFTWSGWPWSSFLMEFTNLVPFRTMWSYVEMMSRNVINTDTVVRFFAGNLIVFLPMGYLLPHCFRRPEYGEEWPLTVCWLHLCWNACRF